uniref:Uncharacterized protein n=1 Tax=uncultured marine virus TaxID=186617 RepID=A0A0F7LAY2_9VIRU|nr:hypothetical protein [uncultured marine virus]
MGNKNMSIENAVRKALAEKNININLSAKLMSAQNTKVVRNIYTTSGKEGVVKTKSFVALNKNLENQYYGVKNDKTD